MRILQCWFSNCKVSVIRDLGLTLAILLTCGFYHFENKRLPFLMPKVRICLFLLFLTTILFYSFCNGVFRRFSFLVFSCVMLLLPMGYLQLTALATVSTGIPAFVQNTCRLLSEWPFTDTALLWNLTEIQLLLYVCISCAIVFTVGFLFSKKN